MKQVRWRVALYSLLTLACAVAFAITWNADWLIFAAATFVAGQIWAAAAWVVLIIGRARNAG